MSEVSFLRIQFLTESIGIWIPWELFLYPVILRLILLFIYLLISHSSLYFSIIAVIIYRWIDVISDQTKKIVGYTAPAEFVRGKIRQRVAIHLLISYLSEQPSYEWCVELNSIAENHDPRIEVDVTRAYYFGSAYNCEMEIILPAGTNKLSCRVSIIDIVLTYVQI